MKPQHASRKLLSLMAGSIAMLFIAPSLAQAADWACTHGHGGNIEYQANVATMERAHIGWGLDFDQKSGLYNWVHFAVPSTHGKSVRYIALQFETGSPDAYVNQIHVYNMSEKIREFNNLGWSGNLQTQVLDMGSEFPISAVGISVGIGAGVEMMSHRFVFTGACAFLTP
jgi:hypothetical protein